MEEGDQDEEDEEDPRRKVVRQKFPELVWNSLSVDARACVYYYINEVDRLDSELGVDRHALEQRPAELEDGDKGDCVEEDEDDTRRKVVVQRMFPDIVWNDLCVDGRACLYYYCLDRLPLDPEAEEVDQHAAHEEASAAAREAGDPARLPGRPVLRPFDFGPPLKTPKLLLHPPDAFDTSILPYSTERRPHA